MPDRPAPDRTEGTPPGAADDLLSRVAGFLLDRRTVLLRGGLDDRVAGEVAAQLMMLDATGDGPVVLHLDSPGGPFAAAFTVIDTIDLLGVPVHTTCTGRAEGSAVGILAVSHRRAVAPHARIHLCEPTTSAEGRAGQLGSWAAHGAAQLAEFVARVADATGRPGEHVEADVTTGRWLSATEAVAYGLADELWRPEARARRHRPDRPERPERPFGFAPPAGGEGDPGSARG